MTAPYSRTVLPGDPPWLKTAFGELGTLEVSGLQNNPKIVGYHACTGLGASDDETPWCSSFHVLGYATERNHVYTLRSGVIVATVGQGA